jgi:hypothetical protein
MLERFNPLLRLLCLALTGLIMFQISQLAINKPVVAHSAFEAPAPKITKTNEPAASTNSAPSTNVVSKTNSTSASKRPLPSRPLTGAMMMGMGGPGGPVNVPPEIKDLVEKIKQSQTLGVEMKPPPMALIGIAGKDVFLRGPNGQEGVVHEGEELGGVKIIRIGINRVLVEENGEQKELTLFNGFGSETLLPQKTNEPPH